MTEKSRTNLSVLDGALLDGLDFCRKVYDLFEQVRRAPDGIARLRLRPTKIEKRLVEELIPLARYVQARYREGRRIKVRWFSGSQSYDAVLWSSGTMVQHNMAPRRVLVEITTSVHPNEHLTRLLLHERGGSFGVKGISRDRQTGEIVSKPHVYRDDERASDLAAQIVDRLNSKSRKRYPSGTVLVVNCIPNGIILHSEWEQAVERVKNEVRRLPFREVFLLESLMAHSATLYGDAGRAARER